MSKIEFPKSDEISEEHLKTQPGKEHEMDLKPIFEHDSYPAFKWC